MSTGKAAKRLGVSVKKVTRILRAKRPNKGKLAALREQARRLGVIRCEIWQRFGSIQPLSSWRKI